MRIFEFVLITFLLLCAIGCALARKLMTSVVIFSAYSIVMSAIWLVLESPDLAITEAAVGAGVTSVLFYLTLRRIKGIMEKEKESLIEKYFDEQEDKLNEH